MNAKLATRLIYFILLISLSTNLIHAKVDTLQRVWLNEIYPDSIRFNAINEFCKEKINDEPSVVLELTKVHQRMALQKNATAEITKAITNRINSLKVLGHYDKALKVLDTLVNINHVHNDSIGLAKSYRLYGIMYHYKSKYLDAVDYFSKSLSLCQNYGMLSVQAKVLSSLAIVYSEINNFDLALEYFDEASILYKKLGDQNNLSLITLNKGFTLFEKKEYLQTINNVHEAKQFFQCTNNRVALAECYYLLAQSFQALNKIDTALYNVKNSLDLNLSIGNLGQIIPTKLLFAQILFDFDLTEATRIGEELLPIVNAYYGYTYPAQTHHLLYKCYQANGNLPLALTMHEKYVVYKDSLLVEEDNIAISKLALETKHKVELLNQQLENEQIQATIKYKQLKRTFTILLASTFFVFLTIFYARLNIQRQEKEKNELLNEIKQLKNKGNFSVISFSHKFHLKRDKIEESIERKINETDWKVLNILLEDPVISNKEIAKKAFLTVDGIGSCLRRMYVAFDIKNSKYKKISLIMKAIKLSNDASETIEPKA